MKRTKEVVTRSFILKFSPRVSLCWGISLLRKIDDLLLSILPDITRHLCLWAHPSQAFCSKRQPRYLAFCGCFGGCISSVCWGFVVGLTNTEIMVWTVFDRICLTWNLSTFLDDFALITKRLPEEESFTNFCLASCGGDKHHAFILTN